MKKIHVEINFDMTWIGRSDLNTLDYDIEQSLQKDYQIESGTIDINLTENNNNDQKDVNSTLGREIMKKIK